VESPGTVPDGRDESAEAAVHALLLRLAGHLPDRLLTAAYDWLAAGHRQDVARAVSFEVISQPLPLDDADIAVLRGELTGDGGDRDLAAALAQLRGARQPEPWRFVSALPATPDGADPTVRPQDLTGVPEQLDEVDRAVVAEAMVVPGITAVWRAWRMPCSGRHWHEPVRVVVVSAADTVPGLAALTVRLRRVLAAAGDPGARAEVCRAGLDAPFYHTVARACGALLWAMRPAEPVRTAAVFDAVDVMRGPWFASNHPVIGDSAVREQLLAALRGGNIIAWSGTPMVDVLDPGRGAVVPLHLRTDGSWVWSDAVAYYLERHRLAPDPGLAAHLGAARPVRRLDEVSLHRALVHVLSREFDDVAWHPDLTPGGPR
jgi:hypothetical protein